MTVQKSDNLRKLNTFLLSLCTSGILWICAEVISLDKQMSEVKAIQNGTADKVTEQKLTLNETRLDVSLLKTQVFNLDYIINQKTKK